MNGSMLKRFGCLCLLLLASIIAVAGVWTEEKGQNLSAVVQDHGDNDGTGDFDDQDNPLIAPFLVESRVFISTAIPNQIHLTTFSDVFSRLIRAPPF